VEQLQAADIVLHLADRRREGKRAPMRSCRTPCGISSPIKADRILALRDTKSCCSIVDFSQAEFRQIVRKNSP
jgi:hypothetical protein